MLALRGAEGLLATRAEVVDTSLHGSLSEAARHGGTQASRFRATTARGLLADLDHDLLDDEEMELVAPLAPIGLLWLR